MQFFGVGAPKNNTRRFSSVQTAANSSLDEEPSLGRAENFFSWPSEDYLEGGSKHVLLV